MINPSFREWFKSGCELGFISKYLKQHYKSMDKAKSSLERGYKKWKQI